MTENYKSLTLAYAKECVNFLEKYFESTKRRMSNEKYKQITDNFEIKLEDIKLVHMEQYSGPLWEPQRGE